MSEEASGDRTTLLGPGFLPPASAWDSQDRGSREAPFKDNWPGLEDGCALMGTRLAQLAQGQEARSCYGLSAPPPWGLGTVSSRQGEGSGRWSDVAARSWHNAGLPPSLQRVPIRSEPSLFPEHMPRSQEP